MLRAPEPALRVWLAPLRNIPSGVAETLRAGLASSAHGCEVQVLALPDDLPLGAQRKWAIARALEAGADYVITVGCNTVTPATAAAIAGAMRHGSDVIVVPRPPSQGPVRGLAAAVAGVDTALMDPPLAAYRCGFLAGVPFDRCARGPLFEWELLLQALAHGATVVKLEPGLAEGRRPVGAWQMVRPALRARLHALGAFLDDRMPPHPEYRFHSHPDSSHGMILRWLTTAPMGRRLLDVGAGSGQFAQHLVDAGFVVTCLEGVPERADACARVTTTFNVDLDAPFPLEGEFDVVVLADVIEHLRTPDLLVERLRRHLSRDGIMIISVPNVANVLVRGLLLWGMFPYGRQGILDRTHVRLFTTHSLDRLLAQAGLAIERRAATPLPFFLARPSGRAGGVVGAVTRLYMLLVRAWPSLFAYQLLRIVRPFPEYR